MARTMSSTLPPPAPITTRAFASRAAWHPRRISAAVHSPPNGKITCLISTAAKVLLQVSESERIAPRQATIKARPQARGRISKPSCTVAWGPCEGFGRTQFTSTRELRQNI